MFSTIPTTGISSWRYIDTAFTASSNATFCGVQTTTAPPNAAFWASVRATSPVPGGRSMTR